MLPALIAAAEGAVATEGAVAAATAAEGATAATAATAAEGAVAAEGGSTMLDKAKKMLDGGSNHNNPSEKSGFAGVGESMGKALASTGPDTDLSGGNSLYRSF